MRIFLDTSVVIAACASDRGASREVFRHAHPQRWSLLISSYVVDEVLANLPTLAPSVTTAWSQLRPQLALVDNVLTLDRAAVFEPAKDRPILFTALAWAQMLLPLDRADFGSMLGSTFYNLPILTPGMFLQHTRESGLYVPQSKS